MNALAARQSAVQGLARRAGGSGRVVGNMPEAPPLRPFWRGVVLYLAGACGALALPPVGCVPVLAVVFLVLLRFAESARSWRSAAWYGFWFGWGFYTAGLYWLTNAILTRVETFWWVLPIASPGCALLLAPLVAIPAVACRAVRAGWPRAFVFAGAWTLGDMARVFIFTGFPWSPLGSAWEWPGRAGDAMIQLASVIGIDGLTLLSVLGALLVWQGRRGVAVVAAGIALWAGFGVWRLHHLVPLPVINPVVVLVQGNVAESEKLGRHDLVSIFERYLTLTHDGIARAQAQAPGRAVVYAWPETAFPGLLDQDTLARIDLTQAGDGALYGLIGTLRGGPGDRWYNSVEAVDARGAIAATYDKATLVPFGEYQPGIVPFSIMPAQLTPGPGLQTWHLPGAGAIGPLVCYEVIFSGHVARRAQRPDWLLNVTNDAWFGDSAGPRQHLASVRMRAVEEGLPIARAANTGISAGYDAAGREIARLGWGQAGSVVVALPPPLAPTVFGRTGRMLPAFLALACIIAGGGAEIVSRRRRSLGL